MEEKKSDSEFLSYNLKFNSGNKFRARRGPPPKIGKNMIFLRKILIFLHEIPQKFSIILSAPPNLKSWIRLDFWTKKPPIPPHPLCKLNGRSLMCYIKERNLPENAFNVLCTLYRMQSKIVSSYFKKMWPRWQFNHSKQLLGSRFCKLVVGWSVKILLAG